MVTTCRKEFGELWLINLWSGSRRWKRSSTYIGPFKNGCLLFILVVQHDPNSQRCPDLGKWTVRSVRLCHSLITAPTWWDNTYLNDRKTHLPAEAFFHQFRCGLLQQMFLYSGPGPASCSSCCFVKKYLKNSYTDQAMAVEGIWYITLAWTPLKKAGTPPSRYTVLRALAIPVKWPLMFTELSAIFSCVLSNVLQTSSGVVIAAETAPAAAPDTMWLPGL